MKLPITIEYTSGKQETYVAQPPEWVKWELKTGNTISQAQERIGLHDLLFQVVLQPEEAGRAKRGQARNETDQGADDEADERQHVARRDLDVKVAQHLDGPAVLDERLVEAACGKFGRGHPILPRRSGSARAPSVARSISGTRPRRRRSAASTDER